MRLLYVNAQVRMYVHLIDNTYLLLIFESEMVYNITLQYSIYWFVNFLLQVSGAIIL